jgi:hypothetical protein
MPTTEKGGGSSNPTIEKNNVLKKYRRLFRKRVNTRQKVGGDGRGEGVPMVQTVGPTS